MDEEATASTNQPRKSVELLIFNKFHKLEYKGYINVKVLSSNQLFIIKPTNEEEDEIIIPFGRQFIQIKNILCIVGLKSTNDLILLFKNEELCERVYGFIKKYKKNSDENLQNSFKDRFLKPLFIDGVENHDELNQRLKEIVKDLINLPTSKVDITPAIINIPSSASLSDDDESNQSLPSVVSEQEIIQENIVFTEENLAGQSNERDPVEIHLEDDANKRKKESRKSKSNEIDPINDVGCSIENRTSETTTKEYYPINIVATFLKKIGTEDKIDEPPMKKPKLSNNLSFTTPMKKILQESDYDLLKFYSDNFKNSRLCIFTSEKDKSLCYEFLWNEKSKEFYCLNCRKLKITIKARIFDHPNIDGKKYIKILGENKHGCEPTIFKPYILENNILKKGNYEIQEIDNNEKRISKKKNLIIFENSEDKNFYRSYAFNERRKIYFCGKCQIKGAWVFADIFKQGSEGEYVKLGPNEHVCKLAEYSDLEEKKNIQKISTSSFLDSSNFILAASVPRNAKFSFLDSSEIPSTSFKSSVMDASSRRLSKVSDLCDDTKILSKRNFEIRSKFDYGINKYFLYVFENKNKEFYYKLTFNKVQKRFICNRCRVKGEKVYATLFKDCHGKFKIHICGVAKHACSLLPYNKVDKNSEERIEKNYEKFIVDPSERPKKKIDFNPKDLFAPESDDDEEDSIAQTHPKKI